MWINILNISNFNNLLNIFISSDEDRILILQKKKSLKK